ncbi:MAG: ribonuclease R [Bacteroidales bacterium]|nr:ribonuclease R [Bacteroidales bacterium]
MASKKEELKKLLKEKIIRVFESSPRQTYNYKQLARSLNEDGQEHRKFISGLLYLLAREGVLIEAYKGKFKLSPAYIEKQKKIGPFVKGVVDMKQTGKAYVITDDLLEDVRIASNNTGYALHGDVVKVRLFPRRKNQKTEGEIIEVIKRSKTRFVGVIQKTGSYAFLLADSKTMPVDIFIPKEHLEHAKQGQKVIAEIIEWSPPSKNPFGKVVEVLGDPGDNEVEMHAILAEYSLPSRFDPAVEKEAEKVSEQISQKEISLRRDFRNVTTVTIDPPDAKDFDDALSIKRLSDDLWEVGVHIADVTHYVKPGSLLEKEAQQRATSIYLVDRTVPMLPEKLSNLVCSLRPREDKLCYSVVFQMNDQARITGTWIGKTIINSDHRFTYDEVQEIIESGKGHFSKEINVLNTMAKQLRKRRMRLGAIDFERQEVKFRLDDKGRPLEVLFKEQKDAHKLIEEFMLLANKRVAERVGRVRGKQKPKTFVYRIHDIPNPEKLNTLAVFVEKLGYKVQTDTRNNIASSFNRLLRDSRGKGEENLIETLTIRTMAKAEYSTVNIGHYGLAFDHYTHFTSPIRRYPDMMVHRLLHEYSNGKSSAVQEVYEDLCRHSSEMEKKAQEAERESIKYKQVEFMADKIGEEYEGLISGVSKWGIFVEIKQNRCEGMVRLRDMDDDYYYLDEENFRVVGHNTREEYKLGSPVRIRIKRADFLKKELDFELVKDH